REIAALIEQSGPQLVELLSQRGSEIASEVGRASEAAAAALEGQKQQLTEAIDASAGNLRSAIEEAAGRSVQSLFSANNRLKSEVADTLQALEAANAKLDELTSKAGGSLAGVESLLGDRLGDFRAALDTVANQVGALNRSASDALQGAQSLTQRIEEQKTALAQSAAGLMQAQQGLDESLEARRGRLENLIATVNTRTDDLNAITSSFSALVEDSFTQAERRARDIGVFLTEATQGVTSAITSQFDEVRSTTGKERERTAAALRSAYEQANAQMREVLESSLNGFRTSAEEMLGLSAKIKEELQNTREELRRGALDLPKETAAQTEAMRKVVDDQVRALNDLTDIVTKSGRAFDVAEPRPAAQKQPEPAPVAAAYTPPVPAPAPAPLAPAPVAPPAPEPDAREAPLPRQTAAFPRAPAPRAPEPPREVIRPEPKPETRPEVRQDVRQEARQEAKPANRQSGWLSDLLARASESEDDAPRPPAPVRPRTPQPAAPVTETLDSISGNIARMVEADAVEEVWQRYYRGDQNIFSRKLYTPRGQQTFETIQRQYKGDQTFRAAVDEYNEGFEKLLQEISREDRDGSILHSYLTSDSGKVYTMLAHASGRFEGM
ncbi:MAG: apolipoprotein acyltransferase, partial [Beijerinckiaceae bacterium]